MKAIRPRRLVAESLRAGPWVLLTLFAAAASAEPGLTREQVKRELAEAIRTGDISPPGDSGLTLKQLYPDRYPKQDTGLRRISNRNVVIAPPSPASPEPLVQGTKPDSSK